MVSTPSILQRHRDLACMQVSGRCPVAQLSGEDVPQLGSVPKCQTGAMVAEGGAACNHAPVPVWEGGRQSPLRCCLALHLVALQLLPAGQGEFWELTLISCTAGLNCGRHQGAQPAVVRLTALKLGLQRAWKASRGRRGKRGSKQQEEDYRVWHPSNIAVLLLPAQEIAHRVQAVLLEDGSSRPGGGGRAATPRLTQAAFREAPEPVRKYLQYALREGHPHLK
jgi:hypothetical protein